MKALVSILLLLISGEVVYQNASPVLPAVLGKGQVPDLAAAGDTVHVVWGRGDSILYALSTNKGASFTAPMVVDVVPGLFSFAMRGPQIAAIRGGACIVACNQQGNLFSYQKTGGNWRKTVRVNDVDTTAKEGFLDVGSDGGQNLFAVWLDLRKGHHNNIAGAQSADGGKTWSANRLLYVSPDGHTCECCKPSVAVQGRKVSVMFRNWVGGNRDLWLLRSANGGRSFDPAVKLGRGAWKLDGCPMDGGGLDWDRSGQPQSVWRRRDSIFAAAAGGAETFLGKGKACKLARVGEKLVYAWTENGEVVLRSPGGKTQVVGKGNLPTLKAVGTDQVIVVWENEKEIQKALVRF